MARTLAEKKPNKHTSTAAVTARAYSGDQKVKVKRWSICIAPRRENLTSTTVLHLQLKNTRTKDLEKEMWPEGLRSTWKKMAMAAQDRAGWRQVSVDVVCTPQRVTRLKQEYT